MGPTLPAGGSGDECDPAGQSVCHATPRFYRWSHCNTFDRRLPSWVSECRAGIRRSDFPLSSLHQTAADDEALDLTGALVEPQQPDVAVDALDGHLPHVPGAAVDLDGEIGHLAGHLGAEQLRS